MSTFHAFIAHIYVNSMSQQLHDKTHNLNSTFREDIASFELK